MILHGQLSCRNPNQLDDIANIVCIKIILVYSAQLSITGVEDESWTEYIRVSHNGDSSERKKLV